MDVNTEKRFKEINKGQREACRGNKGLSVLSINLSRLV